MTICLGHADVRRFLVTAGLSASLTFNALFLLIGPGLHPHTSGSSEGLKVGTMAPPLRARTLDGNVLEVSPGTSPMVLYVISPSCEWCARNMPNINELWRRRSGTYQFVGLSLRGEGLIRFLAQYPLPFPIGVADTRTIADYGLGTTPTTFVIDGKARIAKKWNGAFVRSLPSVERYFGVRLPGIGQATAGR